MEVNVFIRTKDALIKFTSYCIFESLFNTYKVRYVGMQKNTYMPVYELTYYSDENVLDEFTGVHPIWEPMISETCPELEKLPF